MHLDISKYFQDIVTEEKVREEIDVFLKIWERKNEVFNQVSVLPVPGSPPTGNDRLCIVVFIKNSGTVGKALLFNAQRQRGFNFCREIGEESMEEYLPLDLKKSI